MATSISTQCDITPFSIHRYTKKDFQLPQKKSSSQNSRPHTAGVTKPFPLNKTVPVDPNVVLQK